MKLKPIRQQTVVLMGASSGIGRRAALDFARRGARVVVAARDQEGLDSLVDEIHQAGGDAVARVTDTAHFDQVESLARFAVEVYDRIDTWVHLAAVELYATFEDTTPEEFRRVIEINLLGQIYGAKAALPHLRREGRGALIHISSIEARRALPYQSAYAASKHGMKGFIEALRLELDQESVPINVTEILPASINTPLFEKAKTKLGVKPKGVAPIYDPKLVSDAILYAAEHFIREIVVGDAGKLFLSSQKMSARMTDKFLKQVAFTGQRTNQAKSEHDSHNLDETVPGHDAVEGDFSDEQFSRSPYGWVSLHPVVSRTVAAIALGGAAAWLFRGRGQTSPTIPLQRTVPAYQHAVESQE
jgi:NAD(P)-dependent dehydrogenase (short-subunit alcohol dehydrogenase family)